MYVYLSSFLPQVTESRMGRFCYTFLSSHLKNMSWKSLCGVHSGLRVWPLWSTLLCACAMVCSANCPPPPNHSGCRPSLLSQVALYQKALCMCTSLPVSLRARLLGLVLSVRHLQYFFVPLSFVLLGPHPRHMEVPRPEGSNWNPSQSCLPASTTAPAMQDLSRVCELHHSSWQGQILNPLSKARNRTHVLMAARQVRQPLSHDGNTSVYILLSGHSVAFSVVEKPVASIDRGSRECDEAYGSLPNPGSVAY